MTEGVFDINSGARVDGDADTADLQELIDAIQKILAQLN